MEEVNGNVHGNVNKNLIVNLMYSFSGFYLDILIPLRIKIIKNNTKNQFFMLWDINNFII